jgi:hypothetical protein
VVLPGAVRPRVAIELSTARGASFRLLAPSRQQLSAGSRYSGLQRVACLAAFMFDPFEACRSEHERHRGNTFQTMR